MRKGKIVLRKEKSAFFLHISKIITNFAPQNATAGTDSVKKRYKN